MADGEVIYEIRADDTPLTGRDSWKEILTGRMVKPKTMESG